MYADSDCSERCELDSCHLSTFSFIGSHFPFLTENITHFSQLALCCCHNNLGLLFFPHEGYILKREENKGEKKRKNKTNKQKQNEHLSTALCSNETQILKQTSHTCVRTCITYTCMISLRKIAPDCVLYSKYVLFKLLAEFSLHLKYPKYSSSKRQSCLLYLQILFTAFTTYAAVYFQFVAHTLVHSDNSDPASSSPSPYRSS